MMDKTDLITSALEALANRQLGEAYALVEQVTNIEPQTAISYHLLGLLALMAGEPVEALNFFNEAHRLAPSVNEHAEALAITYARLGKLHDALFFAKLSPALAPSPIPGLLPKWLGVFADQFLNIKTDPLLHAAIALRGENKLAEAEAMFRREISLNPTSMDGWRGLADTINALGRPFDALIALQGLVSAGSATAADYAIIGHTLARCARYDASLALYEQAIRRDPTDAGTGSALIADQKFNPAATAASLADMARRWRAGAAVAPKEHQAPYAEPLEGRKLRVGLLSGRLSVAAASLNALSIFLQRGEQVGWELTVFNLSRQDDALTRRLRHTADDWIDFADIDDATAALMIENVGVDVLIALDEVGTNDRAALLLEQPNCLVLAFAQLPGVAAAFGAGGIIMDAVLEPAMPEADRGLAVKVEGTLFGLPDDVLPPLPLRAADEPRVIGTRASRALLNPSNCALLAELLTALPEAMLLLDRSRLGGEAGFEDLMEQFVWYGCADRIVTLADVRPEDEATTLISSCDIFLDIAPFNDVDSAMAALLLGRPVVTMTGDTPAGRATASALTGLGLSDWVANDAGELQSVIGRLLADGAQAAARQRVLDAVTAGTAARPLARAKALDAALRRAVVAHRGA